MRGRPLEGHAVDAVGCAEGSSWRRGLVRVSFWAAMEVFMLAVFFGFLSQWRLPGFALVVSATNSRVVVMIRTATFVVATGSLGVAAGGMR